MSRIKVKLCEWLDYLESRVNVSLYVWGANDELCVNLLDRICNMEEKKENVDRILTLLQKRLLQGCDILKIHCEDCSGLAVGFLIKYGILKHDMSADDLYNLLKDYSVPLHNVQAGDYLFKGTDEKKTHVGYAVDETYAVESKSRDVGVVKTIISEGGWGWACRPDWYEDGPEPFKPVLTRELYYKNPMMHGDDVGLLQIKLNGLDYNCGTADGYFGKKTDIAVRNFQSDNGLTSDGIVGKNTATALGFKWEG